MSSIERFEFAFAATYKSLARAFGITPSQETGDRGRGDGAQGSSPTAIAVRSMSS